MHDACAMMELDCYALLVERLLSTPAKLMISAGGEVLVEAGDLNIDAALAIESLREINTRWWQSEAPLLARAGTAQLVTLPLLNHLGETVAQLIVAHQRNIDDLRWAVNALEPIATCITREINLNEELEALALELTARYEELNLVFETQDDVQDFSETQNYLQKLVDNCHDYMEVGLCGLVLRGQKISFSSVGSGVTSQDALTAMGKIDSTLADWVCSRSETLVVNDVADPIAAVACAGLPYKIVAVPVLGRFEGSVGVLVVAKPYSSPDFTNSDRNLLEVMARKAAKIVQSSFDELTGLVGRAGFEQCIEEALQDARNTRLPHNVGQGAREHAVLLVDIDRMQVINDNFGFEAGDNAIRAVANVLRDAARVDDTVVRLNRDVFGVVLRNCPGDTAELVAEKYTDRVAALKVRSRDEFFEVSVSIGVCPITASSTSLASVFGAAEVALKLAKDLGGHQVALFQTGDTEVVRRQGYMQMVGSIQDALRSDKFELFAQPIVPLNSDGSLHAEILLRLKGDNDEYLSPANFLPAAERYHLMPAIDRWVVAQTLRVLDENFVFEKYPNLVFTINLTGQSLSDPTFENFVGHALDKYEFPKKSICFEITETTAIDDLVRAQKFIAAMRKRDVLFALDDFGTGLSSFAYLKQLDLDYLKIDGGFVKDICTDRVAETMVSAIHDVAQSMNLKTVGEFVVDLPTRDRLIEIGVDYGQGFSLAVPEPLLDLIDSLDSRPELTGMLAERMARGGNR